MSCKVHVLNNLSPAIGAALNGTTNGGQNENNPNQSNQPANGHHSFETANDRKNDKKSDVKLTNGLSKKVLLNKHVLVTGGAGMLTSESLLADSEKLKILIKMLIENVSRSQAISAPLSFRSSWRPAAR